MALFWYLIFISFIQIRCQEVNNDPIAEPGQSEQFDYDEPSVYDPKAAPKPEKNRAQPIASDFDDLFIQIPELTSYVREVFEEIEEPEIHEDDESSFYGISALGNMLGFGSRTSAYDSREQQDRMISQKSAKRSYVTKGCQEVYEGQLDPVIKPKHYDLSLKIDLKRMLFWGNELIYSQVVFNEIKILKLHSKDLTIHEIAYIDAETRKSHTGKIIHEDDEEGLITVKFSTAIESNYGYVRIKFAGLIRKGEFSGLYATEAEGKNGHGKSWAAATQFEPNNARKVFPLIDEPDAKATYNISIISHAGLQILSNQIEESETMIDDQWNRVVFRKTPKMCKLIGLEVTSHRTTFLTASYLLAMFVGDFEYIERTIYPSIRLRVFSPRGKKEDAEFALSEAAAIAEYCMKHFEIEYELPKMDMIALADFAEGAMENWGLMTYREDLLLADKKDAEIETVKEIAQIIAHEIVHQWFGNLVTMKWWTELWLKEGFAMFMQFYIVSKIHPNWDLWDDYMKQEFKLAMDKDSLDSTSRVERNSIDTRNIIESFDPITYAKGAGLIRWMQDWLGEETFRKGYVKYLKQHKYSNACSRDLFDALESVSKKPVYDVMNDWITKKGHPLVTVTEEERNRTGIVLKIWQKRFSMSSGSTSGHQDQIHRPSEEHWQFPLRSV